MEREFLALSGIQHFAFCRRQWALIHVETQWNENVLTTMGDLFHERAHDGAQTEKRGDLLITRGLHITSQRLGVTGVCDVVEFHASPEGITLHGWGGCWLPYPVEYKRGKPKEHQADELQLCAQALCLEEMLCCDIPEGSLFYGETRRRTRVTFTPELRGQTEKLFAEMRDLYEKGRTPMVKPTKACRACSLKELCLPELRKTRSVNAYLKQYMGETI